MGRVFIVGRFPPPADGQTLATQRLAELLDATHEVCRINTSPPDSGYVSGEVKLRPERIRHYLPLRGRIRAALREAPAAPVLWASISPARLGHWRDVLVTTPAFQPDQRVYAVLHRGTFERLFQHPVTVWTARRLVRQMTGFVFLNEGLSEACAPWIPDDKRFVIPNTIDEAVRCSPAEVLAKQERGKEGGPMRLLFLSNMMAEKGYLDVLEAVRILQERGAPVTAHFAGGWVSEGDKAAFEGLVRRYGLQQVVVLHGPVRERSRVKALHLEADVFLLPSYHPTEAQPLAVIEALQAGTPVITTAHGGLPFMVQEGREGMLIPPRSPVRMADAVERLMDYETWRTISQNARTRFEGEFSPERVRTAWEDLLRT